jgi:hypothetical protein
MSIGGVKRILLESEIRAAQQVGISARQCARILGVHVATYKKYAKAYGLYTRVLNRNGKGLKKEKSAFVGKYPIGEILEGKHNSNSYLTPVYVYRKLIRSGVKENKCDICGFSECRITDDKFPLILVGKDGNRHNYHKDNIEIVCYNCYHNFYNGFAGKPTAKING